MTQYIIKRLLFAVLVLFFISLIVFSAVRLIPGDVCAIVAGDAVDAATCDAIETELGLREPLATQYFTWMGGVLTGDFGTSLQNRRDVWSEIRRRIPLTVELTILSTLFALIIAIPVGVYSAVRQDRPTD